MIQTFDYRRSLEDIEPEIQAAFSRVLKSGWLLLGPETEAFEKEFADYVGAAHCVAVASGTTALHLALAAAGIGPGDEVITVSNTCAPTVAAIRLTGARPVFVDVNDTDLMIDIDAVGSLVTERTRAVVPVHLWGHATNLDALTNLARRHELVLVEDCAQAHGTRYRGQHVGTFGEFGCFSFYPTKNIGSYGDAGAVVTHDAEAADTVRRLRMYGYLDSPVSHLEGINGRISEIQAAILRVKLRLYPAWLDRRRSIAHTYDRTLNHPVVDRPRRDPEVVHSFHQYVIRTSHRDALEGTLRSHDVGYGIHYPVPIHRMPAYERFAEGPLPVTEKAMGEILSLPLHESLRDDEARRVVEVVQRFEPNS